jgi:enolase
MKEIKVRFRKTLLSSGVFTPEVVMDDGSVSLHESSPEGLTVGLKEQKRGSGELPDDFGFTYDDSVSQETFDVEIAEKYDSEISTALSLAFLKYKAAVSNSADLSTYTSKEFGFRKKFPRLIFNILNGGKHAGNGLSFCEFMIIPTDADPMRSIEVASEVYHDLRKIILERYSEKDVLVGREGGFAPHADSIDTALGLIIDAIDVRHKGMVDIAIDVAANHFTVKDVGGFIYKVNGREITTQDLFSYYKEILSRHPEIRYIEDCFHENDLKGWSLMMDEFGDDIDVVADDLTVTKLEYTKKYLGLYNSCILKVNQVGTVSGLVETTKFCKQNNIKTIISQRSGETDSNILPHLAVGLGADYMKAGAPARERIIKYNELLRMLT